MTRSGVWSCAVAALLFGASTPAAAVLAHDLNPLMLAGLLYLGAALAVSPWWFSDRPRLTALWRDWRLVAVAIVAGGAIGPALLTAGLVQTPAATTSLLLNLELVATVVLAATLFREHLGARMIVAAVLVTTAGVMLVWKPGATISPSALLIVGACVAWGIDNSATSRIDQIAPHHVTFVKGLVAGTVNLLLGLTVGGLGTARAWAVVGALAIGTLGYGASITLWVRGAQQLGAARGQMIFASAPFLGAIVSWSALSEPIEPVQMMAMAVALVGVGLSLRASHEHVHEHHRLTHTHEHDHLDGHHDDHHDEVILGRHGHVHEHWPLVHAHPHVPDLHHRHEH